MLLHRLVPDTTPRCGAHSLRHTLPQFPSAPPTKPPPAIRRSFPRRPPRPRQTEPTVTPERAAGPAVTPRHAVSRAQSYGLVPLRITGPFDLCWRHARCHRCRPKVSQLRQRPQSAAPEEQHAAVSEHTHARVRIARDISLTPQQARSSLPGASPVAQCEWPPSAAPPERRNRAAAERGC